MTVVRSQQVSWWSVHEFAAPRLAKVDGWPPIGSPAWALLQDRDPVKWAAILDAAQHHALRLELNQEARAEVSRAISGSADWTSISREIHQRAYFYATRPWLKRAVTQ